MKRTLIVGAGGFIGGFMAEESLRRGYETWVTVRKSTSRRFLTDERLHFLVLDYDNGEALEEVLSGALPEGERWDYIVYNLGATKCINFSDFNRINYDYLRTFIGALESSALLPEHFLYISSLSALGEGDEKGYTPFDEKSVPNPNTRYGLSKIKAETFLQLNPQVPWTIFRPTGVYGPHEQDYLMMIKSIDRHFDFGVGYRKQLLTFIYVEDLCRAVFDALACSRTIHRTYIISEERAYTQSQFRALTAQLLGKKWVIPVRLPLWSAKVASAVAEKVGVARMKPSTLNRDKYIIMRQRNWACSIEAAKRDFGFSPRVNLLEGLRRTIAAYREEEAQKKSAK